MLLTGGLEAAATEMSSSSACLGHTALVALLASGLEAVVTRYRLLRPGHHWLGSWLVGRRQRRQSLPSSARLGQGSTGCAPG
jgi:hypothetical protein